jgi:hypothetical protein
MRVSVIATLVIIGCLAATGADPAEPNVNVRNGFLTGNTWRNADVNSKTAYVLGAVDSVYSAALFGANEQLIDSFASCQKSMTGDQVTAVVDKFLNDHPEMWHYAMAVLVVDAVRATCPEFAATNHRYWARSKK